MEDPKFTMIDFNTVQKLDQISDNCTLIFMDGRKSDYIHIKDGGLVY